MTEDEVLALRVHLSTQLDALDERLDALDARLTDLEARVEHWRCTRYDRPTRPHADRPRLRVT